MVEPIREEIVDLEKMTETPKVEPVNPAPVVEKTGAELLEAAVTQPEPEEVVAPEVTPAPPTEEVVEEGPSQEQIDAMVREHLDRTVPNPKVDYPTIKAAEGEDYNKLLEEGKTKEALERMIEVKGVAIAQQVLNQLMGAEASMQQAKVVRQSNEIVYKKYPELITAEKDWAEANKKGETAEVFFAKHPPIIKALADTYNSNPQLRNLPNGAIIAMTMAEDKLRASGVEPVIRKKTKKVEAPKVEVTPPAPIDTGVEERVQRARAAAVVARPASGGVVPPAKIAELSAGDKAAAEFLGMTEAEYAQYKKNTPVFNSAYYAKYRGVAKPKGRS